VQVSRFIQDMRGRRRELGGTLAGLGNSLPIAHLAPGSGRPCSRWRPV